MKMRVREHAREIVRLGTPIVIAQLGTIVQSFADTIMVGQYGTGELSAAGFVNNVFNLALFFILGLSYSTTPVVGAYWGQGKRDEARRSLKESNIVSIGGSLFIAMVLTLLYMNIDILDQPRELYPLIKPYFLTLLVSLPFMGWFNSCKQYMDATGDTRSPMWVMVGGNAINVVGNYLLIFTFDLGLLGAGIATLVSRIIMAVWMAMLLRNETSSLAISKSGVKKLAKMGLPLSVQLCLESCSFNICAIYMGWISAASLAAHQVMCAVAPLCFMIHYGIGAAAAVRISHFCGQNNIKEVRATAFTAYGMTLTVGIVLTTMIICLRQPIALAFTSDAEVLGIVMTLMLPFAVYQFGDCTQIIFSNALRGIGKVKYMMLDAIIAYILVSIPLSYVFGFVVSDSSPAGVWWGTPFGLTTAGVIFVTRFVKYTGMRTKN